MLKISQQLVSLLKLEAAGAPTLNADVRVNARAAPDQRSPKTKLFKRSLSRQALGVTLPT